MAGTAGTVSGLVNKMLSDHTTPAITSQVMASFFIHQNKDNEEGVLSGTSFKTIN
jgi:hypothetical protein